MVSSTIRAFKVYHKNTYSLVYKVVFFTYVLKYVYLLLSFFDEIKLCRNYLPKKLLNLIFDSFFIDLIRKKH